jgi:hypothetical protein
MLRRCASLNVSSCVHILCVLVAYMVPMWAILVYNFLQHVYPLSWYRIHLCLASHLEVYHGLLNVGIWWLMQGSGGLHIVLGLYLVCCLDPMPWRGLFSAEVLLLRLVWFWCLECFVGFFLGILLTFSLVKTDENCLIRICAFFCCYL